MLTAGPLVSLSDTLLTDVAALRTHSANVRIGSLASNAACR